ncbi:hypothetical protein K2X05_04210, partial [bacterium]|nr:hypothetical protein [bacterium]
VAQVAQKVIEPHVKAFNEALEAQKQAAYEVSVKGIGRPEIGTTPYAINQHASRAFYNTAYNSYKRSGYPADYAKAVPTGPAHDLALSNGTYSTMTPEDRIAMEFIDDQHRRGTIDVTLPGGHFIGKSTLEAMGQAFADKLEPIQKIGLENTMVVYVKDKAVTNLGRTVLTPVGSGLPSGVQTVEYTLQGLYAAHGLPLDPTVLDARGFVNPNMNSLVSGGITVINTEQLGDLSTQDLSTEYATNTLSHEAVHAGDFAVKNDINKEIEKAKAAGDISRLKELEERKNAIDVVTGTEKINGNIARTQIGTMDPALANKIANTYYGSIIEMRAFTKAIYPNYDTRLAMETGVSVEEAKAIESAILNSETYKDIDAKINDHATEMLGE